MSQTGYGSTTDGHAYGAGQFTGPPQGLQNYGNSPAAAQHSVPSNPGPHMDSMNKPNFVQLGQGGAHVPRGLANHESAGVTAQPTLNFKSDNAYLTRGEIEQRLKAASQLQEYLGKQVLEKKQQKAAEKQREAEQDRQELV